MPNVKIWLHCVWGTKNWIPILSAGKKSEIINHIRISAGTKGIYIDSLNGNREHLHSLILLNPDHSLTKVMQIIKNESSCWINKCKLFKERFEWADDYYGASVSETELTMVREHIRIQEEHHLRINWQMECDQFILRHGFEKYKV